MNTKVLKEIDNFMSDLAKVNDLHHPNDETRLYNIALEAVKKEEGVPRDEMQTAFKEAIETQKLNRDLFENKYYPQYIAVLERAYDILRRVHSKLPFEDDFRL